MGLLHVLAPSRIGHAKDDLLGLPCVATQWTFGARLHTHTMKCMLATVWICNGSMRRVCEGLETNAALRHKVTQLTSHLVGSVVTEKYNIVGLP